MFVFTEDAPGAGVPALHRGRPAARLRGRRVAQAAGHPHKVGPKQHTQNKHNTIIVITMLAIMLIMMKTTIITTTNTHEVGPGAAEPPLDAGEEHPRHAEPQARLTGGGAPREEHILYMLDILYHIISYHIISYHIVSYNIISYHVMSCHVIVYIILTARATDGGGAPREEHPRASTGRPPAFREEEKEEDFDGQTFAFRRRGDASVHGEGAPVSRGARFSLHSLPRSENYLGICTRESPGTTAKLLGESPVSTWRALC